MDIKITASLSVAPLLLHLFAYRSSIINQYCIISFCLTSYVTNYCYTMNYYQDYVDYVFLIMVNHKSLLNLLYVSNLCRILFIPRLVAFLAGDRGMGDCVDLPQVVGSYYYISDALVLCT